MRKDILTKPDGRYIIFYSFDEGEPVETPEAMEAEAVPEPEASGEQG